MASRKFAALAFALSCVFLAGCGGPSAQESYHIQRGAWTCQDPAGLQAIARAPADKPLDADLVQQYRCTLNPVDWPANVMRVDGPYAYACDVFSGCAGDAVFCQYAQIVDIQDAQSHPADPARLLALAQHRSLQDLKSAGKAMCTK
jgi:hypothetical protein